MASRTFGQPVPVTCPPQLEGLGDLLYLHHVPGHTRGSLVVFTAIGGVVHALAGDLFVDAGSFETRRPAACSWRPELIPAHMDFVASKAKVIIPGHGAPFTIA
jgi:glyoxylase-like metal-dependent hydrolase (beta-lactamase superfamily II)